MSMELVISETPERTTLMNLSSGKLFYRTKLYEYFRCIPDEIVEMIIIPVMKEYYTKIVLGMSPPRYIIGYPISYKLSSCELDNAQRRFRWGDAQIRVREGCYTYRRQGCSCYCYNGEKCSSLSLKRGRVDRKEGELISQEALLSWGAKKIEEMTGTEIIQKVIQASARYASIHPMLRLCGTHANKLAKSKDQEGFLASVL